MSKFVVSYKPQKTEIHEYLEHMDEVLSILRLVVSTFLIGDLNLIYALSQDDGVPELFVSNLY